MSRRVSCRYFSVKQFCSVLFQSPDPLSIEGEATGTYLATDRKGHLYGSVTSVPETTALKKNKKNPKTKHVFKKK